MCNSGLHFISWVGHQNDPLCEPSSSYLAALQATYYSFGSSQLGVGKVGLYLLELDQLVRSLVDKCVVIYFFYILKYIVVFVQA